MKELNDSYQSLFKTISKAAMSINQTVFVIGGLVRDYYLNKNLEDCYDIDLVTEGSGIKLAKAVAKALGTDNLAVYQRFGTARVSYNGFVMEFVGARKESYRPDSRKPSVETGTLEDDQFRRDFTINALSWSLNEADYGTLNDPFNGIRDLKNLLIRTPIDPSKTFSDDPLRMLRAIRFATRLQFSIEHHTLEGIKASADRLSIISKERIIDELNKIISTDTPSEGFYLLDDTGLLKQFFPELCNLKGVEEKYGLKHKDNFFHTLKVLDNVAESSDNLWLRWAAILHDIAKPQTKRFHPEQGWTFHGHDALGASMVPKLFRRLGLPMDERMRYVKKLVRLHLRPIALVDEQVTDSAVRRLIFEAGDDIDDLMLLCRADITSKNDRKIRRYLSNFDHVEQRIKEVEEKDRVRNWEPPIGGLEIMEACNLTPGPVVGTIKKAIEEAILDGKIPNSREAALEYLNDIKKDFIK
ncbi:HD domain-containing protein [Balneolaceae bacterium ANBcel3]|nr:HD domain-containing protein [Balneolaceae bacterium ANBcel3]